MVDLVKAANPHLVLLNVIVAFVLIQFFCQWLWGKFKDMGIYAAFTPKEDYRFWITIKHCVYAQAWCWIQAVTFSLSFEIVKQL